MSGSSIKRYDVIELFPTHIFHSFLDSPKLLEKWKYESIKLLPKEKQIKSYRGNRPWCSNDDLYNLPQFKELVDFIILETNHGLNFMGIERDSHYITSLWLNAQYQDNNHSLHTHSNSLFSGVVYIDIPKNSQSLTFQDPRPQTQILVPSVKKNSNGTRHMFDPANMTVIMPEPGHIYFWPSWLPHQTFSQTYEELERPRLTMAFNIMILGKNNTHSSKFTFA